MIRFIKSNSLIILWLLAAAVTAFIWANSAVDAERSGNISQNVVEIVCGILGEEIEDEAMASANFTVRKIAHFSEFCLLGIIYALIKIKLDGKSFSALIFFPLFCTLLTAVSDEFLQSFTGRGSSVRDVLIDFSGASFGILLALSAKLVSDRRKIRKSAEA